MPRYSQIFQDPLADQTEWTPMTSSGATFELYFARRSNSGLRFEMRKGSWAVLLLSAAIAILSIIAAYSTPLKEGALLSGFVALIFSLATYVLLRENLSPRIFDPKKRQFRLNLLGRKNWLPFDEISAIQLLRKRIIQRYSKDYYNCFELNLVLRDGSRQSVLSQNGIATLRSYAKEISEMINPNKAIPIWDLVEYQEAEDRKNLELDRARAQEDLRKIKGEFKQISSLATRTPKGQLFIFFMLASAAIFLNGLLSETADTKFMFVIFWPAVLVLINLGLKTGIPWSLILLLGVVSTVVLSIGIAIFSRTQVGWNIVPILYYMPPLALGLIMQAISFLKNFRKRG